jgi:hypothetical protein
MTIKSLISNQKKSTIGAFFFALVGIVFYVFVQFYESGLLYLKNRLVYGDTITLGDTNFQLPSGYFILKEGSSKNGPYFSVAITKNGVLYGFVVRGKESTGLLSLYDDSSEIQLKKKDCELRRIVTHTEGYPRHYFVLESNSLFVSLFDNDSSVAEYFKEDFLAFCS